MSRCSMVDGAHGPWPSKFAQHQCLNEATREEVILAEQCCCGQDDCGCLAHSETCIPLCDGPHRYPEAAS